MTDARIAEVARALANPSRVRLLRLLASQTECKGAEIFSELPLAQSTVSEHLKVLRDAGLVNSTPAGTGTAYCLAPGAISELSAALSDLLAECRSCRSSAC
ncbi:MAG: helix-turn-helix transcriptional regulator [Coriobacteriales bacterium]|nr:helix-turn-helix transcriptional regulator [Coriobacteriales bacterium]